MSTVADFNRIDDCDKLDPLCIDAFSNLTLDEDGTLCVETSWDKQCVDIAQAVKDHESCTSLYLSPEENPNCLVYEKEERCGDNDCIHGDDLSRIISLQLLKSTDQTKEIADGDTYIYNAETGLFEPYPLVETIGAIQTTLQNIQQTLVNHENRLQAIEEAIRPPEGAPSNARIVHGVINIYGDANAVIDGNGNATSLDKNYGLYSHSLNTNVNNDQVMG